jgi:hypothetical protein
MKLTFSFGFVAALVIITLIATTLVPRDKAVTPQELEIAISEYLRSKIFVDFNPSANINFKVSEIYYSNALTLLQGKYGHKEIKAIAINEPIDNNHVNIYLFDNDPRGAFKPFKRNCTYTGYRNIIICDIGFIKEKLLLGSHFVSGEEWEMKWGRILTDHVFLWAIGHEIGHLAHNHSGRDFNFDGSAWMSNNIPRLQVSDRREIDADEFAVEAVGDQSVGFFLWLGLSQLAANPKWFAESVSNEGAILLRDCSSTHEPLFKRVITLAQKTIDAGLVIDTTGHFLRILEKIQIEQGGCK